MPPSSAELFLLFDRSPIGMYRSNRDGSFSYVNPALARMLGYTVEELMQVNLDRDIYLDPQLRQTLIAKYEPLGVVDRVQVKWKTRDGRILAVQIWGHVVDTQEGRSFDASVVDVTLADQQREELERTAKMLEMVVRQVPALWWVVDRNLRITRTGGPILEILGYPADQFVGATLHEVHGSDPGSADPIEHHMRALNGETNRYTSDYRGKHFAITVAPYYTTDGAIAGVVGTSLDVTMWRQMERRIVDAQRAESLGVLAGGLAHDFNNLLVAVLGNADLALREVPHGAPGRVALENIRDTGLRAAELTDQLLAYAGRGGAGSVRVQPASIVDELLRITASSLPPQLAVSVAVPPELFVRADPTQMRQVLLNLITNARDAIGARTGTLSITARAIHHDGAVDPDDILAADSGRYVAIEVADDGPGMDRETRRHVFEPFFTTKHTGHGLGLAAVLGIVRAHGGGLRLVSAPGTGAKFTVLWPAAEGQAVRGPSPPSITTARTVLVIDDEDLVRDVVARMVEDLGYSAVTAADGASGLDVLDRQAVDAVLVDMTMPRMTGADVIAKLRERRPKLPVILCSGYDRDARGPVSADAYLPKPFRIDALEQTLAKLLP